jgi:Type II CAAX prenyl endopeptidase Rce1-like
LGVGVAAFVLSSLVVKERQKVLVEQQQQVIDKMLREGLITPKELEEIKQKEIELAKEREKLGKKQVNLPFYSISPIFCFISMVIVAPLGEEAVFRYLIFEIFGKKNPFSYLFSGLGFIFFHWLGPTLGFGGGLLNFTTIKFLFLSYLPMTIFFI